MTDNTNPRSRNIKETIEYQYNTGWYVIRRHVRIMHGISQPFGRPLIGFDPSDTGVVV